MHFSFTARAAPVTIYLGKKNEMNVDIKKKKIASPSNKNCSIYDAEVSYTRFLGALKGNHEVVLLYAILSLDNTFRNVTLCITEKGLYAR